MVSYKWVALGVTSVGSVMASIDSSIVMISLPTILKQLPGTGAGEGLWIIMSYMLVTATLILNVGRLGDMFGKVKMYNLGFAIFTVSSLLCSLSGSGLELILFRMLQAGGASVLLANSAAIITDSFPIHERGRALGMNQAGVVSGFSLGLVLGGILTVTLGWRSIFWVNIPIGVFAIIWSHYKLKELAVPRSGQKLDIWGNVSFAGGLALILLGITLGSLDSWNAMDVSAILLGTLILGAFVYIETRVAEPMFHLSLFKLKIFTAGNIGMLAVALGRGAFSFMMSFYLQVVLGYSALVAGLLLVPLSMTVGITGPFSGWLSDRYGPLFFTSAGLASAALGFLILAQIPAQISYVVLLIPLIVLGLGFGLFSSPNRSETLSAVPAERRGVASGINTTMMNVGMLLSLGTCIAIISASVPHFVVVNVLGGGTVDSGSGPLITEITDFMNGLHNVYWLSAALCILAIIPTVLGYRGSKTSNLLDDAASEKREETVVTKKSD